MEMVLLLPTDHPDPKPRFYALITKAGAVYSCEWTGDGADQKVQDRLAARRALGLADFECTVGSFINARLDGPLPPSMTADQFANTVEIEARTSSGTVDNVARNRCDELNLSVATLGQQLGDTKINLARAGSW